MMQFAQVIAAAAAAPWDDFSECQQDQSFWTGWMNPGACIESPAETAVSAIGESVVQPYLDDLKNGVTTAVKTMVSFWVSVPDPNVAGTDGSVSEPVAFLSSGLTPLIGIVMAFSLMFGCALTMWQMRGEPLRKSAEMMASFIIVQAGLAVAVAAGLEVINWISHVLIDSSTQGTSFADNLVGLFGTTEGVGSAILLGILLLVAALISAITCVLMIARGGILLCLVGSAGLAAVMGVQALRQVLAWIAAFSLYKLAAAMVFAIGFRLIGTDTGAAGNGFLQVLQGLTLLGLAIFALPATMRIVVPLVAPAADGRGAGAVVTGAAIATTAALARR